MGRVREQMRGKVTKKRARGGKREGEKCERDIGNETNKKQGRDKYIDSCDFDVASA